MMKLAGLILANNVVGGSGMLSLSERPQRIGTYVSVPSECERDESDGSTVVMNDQDFAGTGIGKRNFLGMKSNKPVVKEPEAEPGFVNEPEPESICAESGQDTGYECTGLVCTGGRNGSIYGVTRNEDQKDFVIKIYENETYYNRELSTFLKLKGCQELAQPVYWRRAVKEASPTLPADHFDDELTRALKSSKEKFFLIDLSKHGLLVSPRAHSDVFDAVQGKIDILSVQDKIDMALSVLRAVKFMNEKDLQHCDIKPDNILVYVGENDEKTFKLTDLDMAVEKSQYSWHGMRSYFAPEYYTTGKQGYKRDVFSLGVTLWVVLFKTCYRFFFHDTLGLEEFYHSSDGKASKAFDDRIAEIPSRLNNLAASEEQRKQLQFLFDNLLLWDANERKDAATILKEFADRFEVSL